MFTTRTEYARFDPGAYDSRPVSLGEHALVQVHLDEAIQGTAVQVLLGNGPDGTFRPSVDDDGVPIVLPFPPGWAVVILTQELYPGIGWFRLRTLAGSPGSYTNQPQPAARTLMVKGVL